MKRLLIAFMVYVATAAQAQHDASPSDWRKENIYFVFLDRCFDGDPSNDNAESSRGVTYSPSCWTSACYACGLEPTRESIVAISSLASNGFLRNLSTPSR